TPHFSYSQGERAVAITNGAGKTLQTVYAHPMNLVKGQTSVYGWIGHSSKLGWFAIMQTSGNLVTKSVPPPPPPVPTSAATCQVLNLAPLSHTSYQFSATSSTKYGATIKGYT